MSLKSLKWITLNAILIILNFGKRQSQMLINWLDWNCSFVLVAADQTRDSEIKTNQKIWKCTHTHKLTHICLTINVCVPMQKHLLPQEPLPTCSYLHWISSATSRNPTDKNAFYHLFESITISVSCFYNKIFCKPIIWGKLSGFENQLLEPLARSPKTTLFATRQDPFFTRGSNSKQASQ